MSVFKNYSQFYDLFYQQKDYLAETAFIQRVIKGYSPHPVKDILSLGCGTCNHDLLLAKKGYRVTGLDQSSTMLALALKKIKRARLASMLSLVNRDVRKFDLDRQFDFAMAMFNVIGYQTTNQDISQTLQNVASHLKTGGLFLFDCWYAPAVIADPPTDRIRQVKIGKRRIIRLTRSTLYHHKNIVEINFDVLALEGKKLVSESNENHPMRYWSLPELDLVLSNHGLKLIKACPFLNLESEVPPNQWDIFVIAKKL